jgi:hypothetical protein
LWLNESSIGNKAISEETKGITPDQPVPQRGSTMSRKIVSTFTAAAMSMSIALAVPVAVTVVSSLTVVSEAQAGWGSKIKRVTKRRVNKVTKGVKRRAIGVKDIVAGNRCKGGAWVNGHGLCGMTVDPVNTPIRVVKRKLRKVGKACVRLGSCQGTITSTRR